MKKIIEAISFIILLMSATGLQSQNSIPGNLPIGGCAFDDSFIRSSLQQNHMLSAICTNISFDWENKYKLQTHYIPSNNFEAVKTIPINIVIFGEDDYTGFPITPNDVATDLGNYQYWLNFAYAQTQNTVCTPMNPAYLPDSKICFVIKDVYFYNNSAILNDSSSTQIDTAANFHLSNNPDAINEVNCYIVKKFFISGAGGWANTMPYGGQTIPYIMTGSNFRNYNLPFQGIYFYFDSHLPHELGHLVGLWHTYNTETLYINNPEFLDDVFANPPVYFQCDNVMGGNPTNEFISPKQMGRMHRSVSTDYVYSKIRHWVYGYSPVHHEISGNETWDFTFKSYNDIIVKSGATLTLKCRLEMVPQAKIIVEQGGLLFIDGATITSARCAGPSHEGQWQGIEVWGTTTQHQYTINGVCAQGIVELKNGAVIENAFNGIIQYSPFLGQL
jgi:hypothetical protein